MTWLTAYLTTQAIEVPLYLVAGRGIPAARRWGFALGASTVTHPVVWFAFPWETVSWEICFLAAETFAIVAEGWIGKTTGIAHPWRWAIVANAASVGAGFLIQAMNQTSPGIAP